MMKFYLYQHEALEQPELHDQPGKQKKIDAKVKFEENAKLTIGLMSPTPTQRSTRTRSSRKKKSVKQHTKDEKVIGKEQNLKAENKKAIEKKNKLLKKIRN